MIDTIPQEDLDTVAAVECWFSPREQSYVVVAVNALGWTLGSAEYIGMCGGGKAIAMAWAQAVADEYDVPVRK